MRGRCRGDKSRASSSDDPAAARAEGHRVRVDAWVVVPLDGMETTERLAGRGGRPELVAGLASLPRSAGSVSAEAFFA
jgi:hypothetical protein